LNYIVFDLEYNQPSPLNKRLAITMGTERPEYLKFEILQIGAIKIDENFKYISNFKMYVKPKFMPTINRHVLEIINVKERYIKTNSLYFDKVFNEFRNFIGQDDNCTFVTWSNSDLEVLRSNLDAWNIAFETSKYRHIDLQEVVMKKQGLELHSSLEKIANEYKINYNLIHDAYADANVTKQLFQKIGICESKPYNDNIIFKLNKKMKKHNNEILVTEINKTPHCNNCGKFIKTNIKTNFYTTQSKDALYMKKLCYCDKCKLYSFINYKYDFTTKTLYEQNSIIREDNQQRLNKVKEKMEFIKQIENIQLNIK
jgi:inhibitor of KinA sporulation pathway (predicted exonuclease)